MMDDDNEKHRKSDGWIVISKMMMRAILDEDPLNQRHAEMVVRMAEVYKRHWDVEALEIARQIWRKMKETETIKMAELTMEVEI